MKKKKNYNPFKMWGSYVGAGIGFFIALYWYLTLNNIVTWTLPFSPLLFIIFFIPIVLIAGLFGCKGFGEWGLSYEGSCKTLITIGGLIAPIIMGFLIGWGIHSLIRALRK